MADGVNGDLSELVPDLVEAVYSCQNESVSTLLQLMVENTAREWELNIGPATSPHALTQVLKPI